MSAKPPEPPAVTELKASLARIDDLGKAAAVLSWDQQTYMPPGGVRARVNQLTRLSELAHAYSTDPQLGAQISAAEEAAEPGTDAAALVRVARREYDQATKLSPELVSELTQTTAEANQIWEIARAEAGFKSFAPHLTKIVELSRQVAEACGYADHPYDGLLDIYEPGMTTKALKTLFSELEAEIVPLVKTVGEQARTGEDESLHGTFDEKTQLDYAWQTVTKWGLDAKRSRQDLTTHPFCTSFDIGDVRITTRVREDYLPYSLFPTMHESGHAMYEQGIKPSYARGPLGRGASLGVHESQSGLWENLVGRSKEFWKKNYVGLLETFPQLKNTSLADFYLAINAVKPSFIRVEADELTYNLHILMRFDLETALLDGNLKVQELPEAWNAKVKEYLGITPPSDAQGVLQDVHWSAGLIGYFPTYTIGNVLSVQLWDAAQKEAEVAKGVAQADYAPLLQWLRTHVHQHGAALLPAELTVQATGQPLNTKPYLSYLKQKYSQLYGLNNA